MNHQHLFKYSKSYDLLKKYVGFVHSLYYKEICVINAEKIPVNEPVIFAPNHQNALMDALAILLTIDKQPVFMARADIFKQKTVSKILNFLKIIPVYRIRDGIGTISYNDESFDVALRALGYGQPVGIMPEGNHGDQHRLRPLKKGIARFALKAQENLGDTVSVKIVPVGLEFSHYSNFRSKLLVIYGEPINVSDFFAGYVDNPKNAFMALMQRLADELKTYMLDIDTHDYYSLIFTIKEIYTAKLQQRKGLTGNYYSQFQAEKLITDKLVKMAYEDTLALDSLNPLVNQYTAGLSRYKLEDWVFDEQLPKRKDVYFDSLKYLFFLPVFLFTVAFNFIPLFVSIYFSEKIEDTQFRSSFKFVLFALLFPLYYLIFLFFPIPFLTKVIIILPMPVLGILSFDYFASLKRQWIKYSYFRLLKKENNELAILRQVRTRILRILDEMFG